jgi:hypothetical protein
MAEDGSLERLDEGSLVFGDGWIGVEAGSDTIEIQGDLLAVRLTEVEAFGHPSSRTLYFRLSDKLNQLVAQVWLSDEDMEAGFESFAVRGDFGRLPASVAPDTTALGTSSDSLVQELIRFGTRARKDLVTGGSLPIPESAEG